MIISGCFQLTEDVVVYVGLRAHNYGWAYLRGILVHCPVSICTSAHMLKIVRWGGPEGRHGSARAPGHVFLA
jgi:hypothetical protein